MGQGMTDQELKFVKKIIMLMKRTRMTKMTRMTRMMGKMTFFPRGDARRGRPGNEAITSGGYENHEHIQSSIA